MYVDKFLLMFKLLYVFLCYMYFVYIFMLLYIGFKSFIIVICFDVVRNIEFLFLFFFFKGRLVN